jgi:hypothetical protein
MKRFYSISSYALAVLGLIHTAMTPVFYPSLSLNAVWFAGTGISLIFLAGLNLASLRARMAAIRRITMLCNSIFTVFCIMIIIMLPEPQSYIAILLAIAVLIGSIINRPQ